MKSSNEIPTIIKIISITPTLLFFWEGFFRTSRLVSFLLMSASCYCLCAFWLRCFSSLLWASVTAPLQLSCFKPSRQASIA
ncbi:hypothetical protein 2016_scaffold57_00017 [Bacteriophage sp.]|nr:hypothetical protein 2016_scaffold57_00017 [Bacteriophage sp.]